MVDKILQGGDNKVHVHTELSWQVSSCKSSIFFTMANETDFFFTPYALMLIPRRCHDEFFVNMNFLDGKKTSDKGLNCYGSTAQQ